MGSKFLESFLPGIRDLRAPLVGGLMWLLFFGAVFGEEVPDRGDATGFAEQVYRATDAAGPWTSGLVASILVFVLGAMTQALSLGAANAVGRVVSRVQRHGRWREHAEARAAAIEGRIAQATQAVADAARRRDSTDEKAPGRKQAEANVQQSVKTLEDLRTSKQKVEKLRRKRLGIPESPESRALLGELENRAGEGLERLIVERARLAALDTEMGAAGSVADLEDLNHGWDDDEQAKRLLDDVSANPLDAAHALDLDLYQIMDRDRAEQEVRIAFAPPVGALAVLAATRWSPWVLLVLIPATLVFVQSSLGRAGETTRVLRRIAHKGAQHPVIEEARIAGRTEYREFERERLERERAEEAARAERERKASATTAPAARST